MPDSPLPSPPPPPAPQAPVDGLTAATLAAAPAPPVSVGQVKKRILIVFGAAYCTFLLGCGVFLAVLPLPTGGGKNLVLAGLLWSLVGVAMLLGAGWLGLKRISGAPIAIANRRRSILLLAASLLPGVALGAATPVLILREPSLPMDIVDPVNPADFVAPVAVTLSAERATAILRQNGLRPVQYQWDTDGDGAANEETVVPRTTAVYDRQGSYTAVVRILLEGGGYRRVVRRIAIPQAVFSVQPIRPVIEKPLKFSVVHLLTDPKQLKSVQWDFGDGSPTETSAKPDAVHTYYAVGAYPVTAVVQLLSNTQGTYRRTVNVQEQPPLPFPITLTAEPASLVGPVPFGVLFRLQTDEVLKDIAWSFGDGKEDRGASLLRESHAYESPGIYPVTVRARSESGSLAELSALVRATDMLALRDLKFDGSPVVLGGKISGEVPLEISLTPKTTTPLVEFAWELPEDTSLQVTDGTLTGVYRREGTFTVTLMALGAEGRSMRMPITITVQPPSAEPAIQMKPDGGVAPLEVAFDASQTFIPPEETVAGFKWLFGDEAGLGTKEAELGGARVTHTYQKPGEYVIQLFVVLTSGKEYAARRTIIVRKPSLSACVTASRLTVQAGKGVEFDSSCSSGSPSALVWDVRLDREPEVVRAQSEEPVYVHVFDEPGDYTITLILKDSFGNEDRASISITVSAPANPEPAEVPEPL